MRSTFLTKILVILTVAFASFSSAPGVVCQDQPQILGALEEPLEVEITVGSVKSFRIDAQEAGSRTLYFTGVGVDFVVSFLTSDRKSIAQWAIPANATARQRLDLVFPQKGTYLLEIKAFSATVQRGRVTIEQGTKNTREEIEATRKAARIQLDQANQMLESGTLEDRRKAVVLFREAARQFERAGDILLAKQSRQRAGIIAADIGLADSKADTDDKKGAIDAGVRGELAVTGLGIELVFVPAGTFKMGGSVFEDEKPVHEVTIRNGFWMGRHEVTQDQFKAVMGTNPSHFKACGGKCPVETVSWNDAKEFVKRLNSKDTAFEYYLPSEAEWEYAAKAGSGNEVYGPLKEIAWFGMNSKKTTHQVGQLLANDFGLFDMIGNVWEWVEDGYDANRYRKRQTGRAPNFGLPKKRVFRGGSWDEIKDGLRATVRIGVEPEFRSKYVGFRIAAVRKSERVPVQ